MNTDRSETTTLLGEEPGEFFAGCFERFYGDVFRYARRRVGPDVAGDVAAEVFLVAWRRVGDLAVVDNPLAWLYGVARLTVANIVRSEQRRSALHRKATAAVRPDEIREPSGSEGILAALARLSPKDQEVLRLVAWEGLKGEDLAVALGTSLVAARARRYRARRRLEEALKVEQILSQKGEQHA